MSTKHTPGPWRTKPGYEVVYAGMTTIGWPLGISQVCVVSPNIPWTDWPVSRSVKLANVRLIAAAPELLEALRTIERNTVHANTRMFARAAIAKAEK